jgi:hypothetical protein
MVREREELRQVIELEEQAKNRLMMDKEAGQEDMRHQVGNAP